MTNRRTLMQSAAALVVILVEVFIALAVAVGAWTRPLALLLALYPLGTGLIGHPFWTMAGAARYGNAINFYKNISIIAAREIYRTNARAEILGEILGVPIRHARSLVMETENVSAA